MTVSSAQSSVAAAAILQDARFVLRTAHAVVRNEERHEHVPVMALTPILSLITHETRRWVNRA
ncbi:hypothetical protein BKA24_002126 [Microbacterium marinum]|jgi:hypothetical protein|uniref:Uncharacterized protein n=1 Tax=Microbacterium marinum TaxID=421115 RepID=A0A7W7FIT4_9MICO|nr:hypothetical protein [Microbacterium marinum]MBB4667417.1 hypothetical protein [Microbacterium marinum]